MSLLNWNLDSNSPTNREETKQAMILAVINAIYAITIITIAIYKREKVRTTTRFEPVT